MADNKDDRANGNESKPMASRETTMKSVASSLAVMFLEESIRKGRDIEFPSLRLTITREDLLGSDPKKSTGNNKPKSG